MNNAQRLLLLSNSTIAGREFLEHASSWIRDFLGDEVGEVLFIPYASVRASYDTFTERVRERLSPLGYDAYSVHAADDPVAAVSTAAAIVVGGGNTFCLLERLYALHLLDPIRERVRAGHPYIGWSAGANLACPTIRTTNDMPIVEPPHLAALGLVPFQINPHYTHRTIPEHAGETREERLLEFVAANPETPVLGLREGTALRVEGDALALLGDRPARVFGLGGAPFDAAPGAPLDGLRRA
jgi:dipeptidase E